MTVKGVLLVNKAPGSTSFQIVSMLRRLTREKTIGHAGTLDPFATGVMVMLIGREFTRLSNTFLECDKTYLATLTLGVETDTFDLDGQVVSKSERVPSEEEVAKALAAFQGEILQVPPMFSAKKVEGKKLYELARKGIVVEREPVKVRLAVERISYKYPYLEIAVDCSKGTYIRSLAHDLGKALSTGAHLSKLTRIRSGGFKIEECIAQESLKNPTLDLTPYLRTQL